MRVWTLQGSGADLAEIYSSHDSTLEAGDVVAIDDTMQAGVKKSTKAYDEMATNYNLMDCFECGSCSYVCPSHIPLVQYFRSSKSIVRKRNAAAKAAQS